MKTASVLINYFLDGPCGDCPKALTCTCECIYLIAFDESKKTVRRLTKGMVE